MPISGAMHQNLIIRSVNNRLSTAFRNALITSDTNYIRLPDLKLLLAQLLITLETKI